MNTTLVETDDKLLYLASKGPAGNYGVLKASGYFYNDGTGRLSRPALYAYDDTFYI